MTQGSIKSTDDSHNYEGSDPATPCMMQPNRTVDAAGGAPGTLVNKIIMRSTILGAYHKLGVGPCIPNSQAASTYLDGMWPRSVRRSVRVSPGGAARCAWCAYIYSMHAPC